MLPLAVSGSLSVWKLLTSPEACLGGDDIAYHEGNKKNTKSRVDPVNHMAL